MSQISCTYRKQLPKSWVRVSQACEMTGNGTEIVGLIVRGKVVEMKSRVGGLVTKLCLTLETPWTVAHHAPLSMRFPRQGYWSGLPFPSPRIKPRSPALQADSLPTKLQGKPSVSSGKGIPPPDGCVLTLNILQTHGYSLDTQ